jgi:cysteine synthase A
MNYAQDLSGLVGRTPLVKICHGGDCPALLLAKLEFFNPSSSVKDRTALGMLSDAEARGLLKPGAVVVEPTSGNTGIGLAWLCAIRGYRLVLTMPDTMSVERRKILHGFGAKMVLTPGPAGMAGAVAKAEEILAATPGAFMPRQFSNPANPAIHEATTAEEIWADTDGKIDIFIAGVGTGGTLTGVARALKKKKPGVKVVAVEPGGWPRHSQRKTPPPPPHGGFAAPLQRNYRAAPHTGHWLQLRAGRAGPLGDRRGFCGHRRTCRRGRAAADEGRGDPGRHFQRRRDARRLGHLRAPGVGGQNHRSYPAGHRRALPEHLALRRSAPTGPVRLK